MMNGIPGSEAHKCVRGEGGIPEVAMPTHYAKGKEIVMSCSFSNYPRGLKYPKTTESKTDCGFTNYDKLENAVKMEIKVLPFTAFKLKRLFELYSSEV